MSQEVEKEEAAEELPIEQAAAEAEADAAGGEEFKYELPDGSKHKTQEEALAHAQKLIQAKDVEIVEANAYQRGIQDSAGRYIPQGNVTPAAPTAEDTTAWETEFYTDPKKVISQIKSQAIEEAEARITQKISAKEGEAAIWNEFSTLHPDLADFKDDVDRITDEHKVFVSSLYQTKGKKAAMDYVAQKTRAKHDLILESRKARKELPRTKTATPTPGQTSVTQKKIVDEPLDFTAQMRKHKAERMGY